MNKRRTMTYAVAAATAATLLLAGCNGGDEDTTATPTGTSSTSSSTSPTGSSTATSSASPSPSVSISLPSAARANTEAGAIAFANNFVMELNSADVSGNTQTIRELSGPTCSFCLDLAKLIDDEAALGNHMDHLSFAVADSQVTSFASNAAVVGVLVNDGAANRVSKSGAVLGKKPVQKLSYSVTLAWRSDAWTVQGLEIL